MASRNATIAEAVKVSLNAAFAGTFVAKRVYVPAVRLADLDHLTVTVFAGGDDQTTLTRAKNQHDVKVEVGIQKRLTAAADPTTEAANAEIDALTELAEQVADHFRAGEITPGAGWTGTTLRLPDTDHLLLEESTFTALVTVTFRAFS